MTIRHVVLAALLTSAGACADDDHDTHGEPGLPRAVGTISTDAAITPTDWTTLELRFVPTDPAGELAGYRQSFSLATTELPMTYSIGGDLGVNQWNQWTLTAWLTNAATPADSPEADEPDASIQLEFDCSAGCPSQHGIELVID